MGTQWLAHILASGTRLSGLIPAAGEETFLVSEHAEYNRIE